MIIGLTGKAGAGKDTFADLLVRDHGFVKIGLADEMKRFLHTLGFPPESLWGPSEEREKIIPRFGKTSRQALKPLGTKWGRAYHENIWIWRVLESVKAVQSGQVYDQKRGLLPPNLNGPIVGTSVVIPDCRFRNEFDAIRAVGGKMIRILREGTSAGSHISETEQDSISLGEYDHVYANTGTIEDMRKDLIEWISAGGGQ